MRKLEISFLGTNEILEDSITLLPPDGMSIIDLASILFIYFGPYLTTACNVLLLPTECRTGWQRHRLYTCMFE